MARQLAPPLAFNQSERPLFAGLRLQAQARRSMVGERESPAHKLLCACAPSPPPPGGVEVLSWRTRRLPAGWKETLEI